MGVLFMILSVLTFNTAPGRQEGKFRIIQSDQKISIDGKLDDWKTVPPIPVNRKPSGEIIPPSPDLNVAARFTFDADYFYAVVEVTDDEFEFSGRNRNSGDMLFLTFFDPRRGNSSDRFYMFGFSLREKNSGLEKKSLYPSLNTIQYFINLA